MSRVAVSRGDEPRWCGAKRWWTEAPLRAARRAEWRAKVTSGSCRTWAVEREPASVSC